MEAKKENRYCGSLAVAEIGVMTSNGMWRDQFSMAELTSIEASCKSDLEATPSSAYAVVSATSMEREVCGGYAINGISFAAGEARELVSSNSAKVAEDVMWAAFWDDVDNGEYQQINFKLKL